MSFNIDIAIVIGFLLVTLVVGMYKGQNIQNIKEFALGNRNFTTVTLVCTIVATWIGGEDFFILISESYTDGLYFILALAIYPDVAAEEIAKHIILDYSYSGLKGLTIAGILAMMMSTADSYINSTSVLFTHDFCSAAGIKIKNELIVSRMIALILGVFSFVLALYSDNLLKLIITTKSFYMPLVSVPFIFSIIGFRSSAKSVLIGMLAGFITVVL